MIDTASTDGKRSNILLTSKKSKIIERCFSLYVAAVSDAADEIGIHQVCMDRGIVPLTRKTKTAGFARTAKLVRAPVQLPYNEAELDRFMSVVTKANRYDIVLFNNSAASDCSAWGQVLTRIGVPLGVTGAIVDGTARDIDDIDEMSFVVFGRGRHPGTMRGRMSVEFIRKPIQCGDVTVAQGDLVFGDGDGVVVVPQDQIDDVLCAAEEIVRTDEWWASKLDEGKDPHDLHKEKPIP